MTLLSPEILAYLEAEERKLILKNVLIVFNPREGIYVVGLLEYVLSAVYLYMIWLQKREFLDDAIVKLGDVFDGYAAYMSRFTNWVLLDRTIVVLSNTLMLLGHFKDCRTMFLPFLIWLPIATVANGIMELSLLDDSATKWLVPWFVIFFEVNSWICVVGQTQLLVFRETVTKEYRKFRARVER